MLLYPVYTLLFSDAGLSVWQISSLFAIWSVSSIVFEVPSGAWADATSRRALLIGGPLLTAVAFVLWLAWPSYWSFALGFLLWGLKGALTSGALEALVYDELDRVGAAERYPRVMGRAEVAGVLAAVCSGLVAAPVLSSGGFAVVGVASVAAVVLASLCAILLPEHRIDGSADEPELGWSRAVAAGFAEARTSSHVRGAVVMVAVVASIWGALDEYTPLLLASFGTAAADVALLMVVVWGGAAVGGLLAEPVAALSRRALAAAIWGGAALMAFGALSGHGLGVVAIALAFGVFQAVTIAVDARLQHAITGPARATVTSLAGMSTDVTMVFVYATYAAVADVGGHGAAFGVLMIPYVAMALRLFATRGLTSTIVEGEGSTS